MKRWQGCRQVGTALLVVGFGLGFGLQPTPVAWAQLQDVDPALHAAVEALVANDPEIVNDPELAELCRTVAEATVLDPAERAAVTNEVVALRREGVDLSTVIPPEVRDAAREQYTQWQRENQAQLETLRATNPQAARELELTMREGERCMLAFESGERYVPSTEMVAHAETMMREWESDMLAQGAPPEYIDRARQEFAAWSSGEMVGPGHEFGGPGPGGMPSLEQMEQMVASGQMTPEQLQMATEYMQGGFESYQAGMEAYHTGMEYGQVMDQQYMEHYATEYNYTPPENLNYDNLQQQQFEQMQHAPITEHRVANGDGHDEGHWDGNADGIADHTHPLGTTPH